MSLNGLTSENLKSELWTTMKQVKSRKMKPNVGNTIISAARGILSVVKLEVQVAKMIGKKPTYNTTKFLR